MTNATITISRADIEVINRICASWLEKTSHQKDSAALSPKRPWGRGRPIGTVKRRLASGVDQIRLDKILAVIQVLDPRKSSHWTAKGLPSASPIQKLSGLADVAHWEIQLAFPDYNRAQAVIVWKDMNHLHFRDGQWIFTMKSGKQCIRKRLKTASANEARKLRDRFLDTGSWALAPFESRMKSPLAIQKTNNKLAADQSPEWAYSDSHPGWRKQ